MGLYSRCSDSDAQNPGGWRCTRRCATTCCLYHARAVPGAAEANAGGEVSGRNSRFPDRFSRSGAFLLGCSDKRIDAGGDTRMGLVRSCARR